MGSGQNSRRQLAKWNCLLWVIGVLVCTLSEQPLHAIYDRYFVGESKEAEVKNYWNNYFAQIYLNYDEAGRILIAKKLCEKGTRFSAFVDCKEKDKPVFKEPISIKDKGKDLKTLSRIDEGALNELSLKELYHSVYEIHCDDNPGKVSQKDHLCSKTTELKNLSEKFDLASFNKLYNTKSQAAELTAEYAKHLNEKYKDEPFKTDTSDAELNHHANFAMAYRHIHGNCGPKKHPAIAALEKNLVKILMERGLDMATIAEADKQSRHLFLDRFKERVKVEADIQNAQKKVNEAIQAYNLIKETPKTRKKKNVKLKEIKNAAK